ncbi:PilW family protein [Litoribacillus peritrichatus]|uniref:Prepilin-type N-terminal cleavage/methylation domain-containing protein n=1 Tax=Litoribacillus peritrichatus TaxID=718191 RepID=A0ABP7M2Y5_9GAMM
MKLPSLQKGITLIEVLIGSLLGFILSAAIMAAVINSNIVNRESMKSVEITENGRFLNSILRHDIANAGFYDALGDLPFGGASVDPCNRAIFSDSLEFPIQAFNDTDTPAMSAVTSCDLEVVDNTDVLVVRRASSLIEDSAALPDEYNFQADYQNFIIQRSTDPALFPFTNKQGAEDIRRYLVHIYYVSPCPEDDCSDGSATDSPTLKRLQLENGEFTQVVVAEGVEQFQVEYGIDRSGNGIPNESGVGLDDAYIDDPNDDEMQNIVSIRYYMIVRSTEESEEHKDSNSYDLGEFGIVTGESLGELYKRRLFMNLTRVVNIASKRES